MPTWVRTIVVLAMVALSPGDALAQQTPASSPTTVGVRDGSELTAGEASDVLSAATSADAAVARRLLQNVALAERSIMPGGEPAVSVAARYGTAHVLAAFLQAGGDVRAQGPTGWTPLFAAIAVAQADNVRLLLERGADPTVAGTDNVTPLDLAMAIGDPRIINMLQAVLTEQATSPTRYSQLLLQAAASGDTESVALLLKNGKGVDVTDELGWTPLLHAVAAQSAPTVTLLLEAKANVNHLAQKGVSPLMVAAVTGNRDLVDLLLSRGANKALANGLGQTAGTIALASAAGDIAAKLGASADTATSHRLLAAAAARKDAVAIKALLDKGTPAARPVNAPGDTPAIVVAACTGDVDVLKLLLERGAKVDEADSAGVTPLIASALCNRRDAAAALLAAKASPQTKTKDGLDALTAAVARGHADVVGVLAPSAQPTLDAVFDALQRKDLKILTALVKGNPDLATRRDQHGKTLLAHAIMVAEPAMIEAVAGMPGIDVNASLGTDTPLTFALLANRMQAARTLVKLGARPTVLVYQNAVRKTAFELAAERGATDLLQAMSQAARNELSELQSNLFTMGLLASRPDGSWGPATQAAWEKARERAGNRFAVTMGDLVGDLARNSFRICNQTAAGRDFALHVESLIGTFKYLYGWYRIDSGKCRSIGGVNDREKFYVTAGDYKLQDTKTGGARFTYCTKNDVMGRDVTAGNALPPCSDPFKPTSFVLVTDQTVPFVAR
jgi:ankyrin repeat protein